MNSAEERICPFYQLIHMNVIMGGNYICLVVCLLSVMKCRVYTTPLCFYYKNPPYDTQTHTHNHTQRERERKERKEVSCQVFKISFRKNKASQIRARSLLLAVRRGEKAGQQSTKASIFLKLLFRESIYSPIFSSSYPNLRFIPFLLSLLCLTRPSSPVTQSCVFPLNI